MSIGVVAPLLVFALLVAAFAFVLRRTGRVIADTREAEGFRRRAQDLGLRVDVSLGGIIERIDGVRRHKVPPADIGENLSAALAAVASYQREAEDLDAPASAAALTAGLRAELGRAERALEMVEHGCGMLAAARGMARDIEGETAVKRGYLNLLHAREAVVEYTAEIVDTDGGVEPRWYSRRRSA